MKSLAMSNDRFLSRNKQGFFNPKVAFATLVIISLFAADAVAGGTTPTSIGNEINKGFKAIYEMGKVALGGVALAMALWKVYQWYGGDQNAPKQLAMIGVISIIGLNLDKILGLFGLTL